MHKITYSKLKREAEAYWKWAEATPAPAIPAPVAREGAGSELRTPIMHYGTVMPVYLAVARYLSSIGVKKGMRLIELGSGSGRPLTYLKVLFPDLEVWGVDYSKDGVEYAEKTYGKFGVKFKHVKAQDTTLEPGYFDFVISSHVIEHITKEEGLKFIKETQRLLKNGGYGFIGTPERRMCQELYAKNPGDKKEGRLVPPHVHEYELEELQKLAEEVFPKNSVRVDSLTNPTFHKIFKASIDRIKPSGSVGSRMTNTVYRTIRDKVPRPIFDTIGRAGAAMQMRRLGITFPDVLLDNGIASAKDVPIADNLLLVCYKK